MSYKSDFYNRNLNQSFQIYMGNYIYKKNTKLDTTWDSFGSNPANSITLETLDKHLLYSAVMKPIKKVLVFDLDETIGSFSDLYCLWKLMFPNSDLDKYPSIPSPHQQSLFNSLLDLYPEFLRPGIISILTYLKSKILEGKCHKIFVYTNNQCEDPAWVNMIVRYLDRALDAGPNETFFDKPIYAFKINNRIIDYRRTTDEKTYSDFVKCSMLPKKFEMCFIDDLYHRKMHNKKVFYIQAPAYCHHLSREEIMRRFIDSDLKNKIFKSQKASPHFIMPKEPCVEFINSKNQKDTEIYHKLLYHIKEFFIMSLKPSSTKHHRHKLGKFTIRNRKQK
jgi:hypothetical protein